MKGKPYTQEEDDFIRDHIETMTDHEIAKALDRTYEGVHGRRKKLHYHRSAETLAQHRARSGENNPAWKGGIYSKKRAAYNKRRKKQEPEKRIARELARTAIKRGKLLRVPCEVCGNAKVDAHHEDYSKPLDVRWLCRKHHLQHHRQMRKAS